MSRGLSILIVRLSAVGDVVMTTAVARALKRHLPDSKITWVVEPLSAAILEGNPDIDEVIVWQERSLVPFLRLMCELRRQKFDAVLDFQGLLRSALVTLASGARRRIGFANGREKSPLAYNERIVCAPRDGGRCYHSMRCYMAFLERLGVACDDGDGEPRVTIAADEAKAAEEILRQAGVAQGEPTAVLCAATTHSYKHWTEEGWSRLAEKLWNEARLRPVFLGAYADQPLVGRILSGTSAPAVSLAGCTTLKQAAAVIDRSALVVSVDTGLLHVGAALGRPTVGVFGPTMAWRNHVHRANFAVARKEMDCVPCRKKPTCHNFDCISSVKPEEVLAAARMVMSRRQPEGVLSCPLE